MKFVIEGFHEKHLKFLELYFLLQHYLYFYHARHDKEMQVFNVPFHSFDRIVFKKKPLKKRKMTKKKPLKKRKKKKKRLLKKLRWKIRKNFKKLEKKGL